MKSRKRAAGVRELKAHLSGYLRDAAAGDHILITDRGRVVAELHPAYEPHARATPEARLQHMVEAGTVRPASAPADRSWATWPGLKVPEGTARRVLEAERGE